MSVQDLTGQTFNFLTVLERAENRHKMTTWKCECVCGNITYVVSNQLTKNKTKSCGCKRRKADGTIGERRMHGHSVGGKRSPEYRAREKMILRCTDKDSDDYKNYGERGITYDPRWEDFTIFLEEVGLRPSNKHSLDRKDTNGNYCKDNCKWSTKKEQNNNKRNNVIWTYKGFSQNVSQWAEEVGLCVQTLWRRVYEYGWDIPRALTTPSRMTGYTFTGPKYRVDPDGVSDAA